MQGKCFKWRRQLPRRQNKNKRLPLQWVCYNNFMGLEELEQKDYFSIGDVKRITGVPEYSVRYWEAEFGLIKPIRLESGHRRYTKEDVYTILKIKDLIYKHKLTLEGAKKQLSKYSLGNERNSFTTAKRMLKYMYGSKTN